MSGANNKNCSMQIRVPVWSKKYDFYSIENAAFLQRPVPRVRYVFNYLAEHTGAESTP